MSRCCLLIAFSVWAAVNSRAEDKYSEQLNTLVATPSTPSPPPDEKVAELEKEMAAQVRAMAHSREEIKVEKPPPSPIHELGFMLAAAAGLALILPPIVARVNRRFNPWASMFRPGRIPSESDEESFAAFAAALGVVKTPVATRTVSNGNAAAQREAFYAATSKQIISLRKLFARGVRGVEDDARRELFEEILHRVRVFKLSGDLQAIMPPAWQTVIALEGLLRHLAGKPESATPSARRTAASGLDLLAELCAPEVRSDLATDPPVRLLAVDDEPIWRHAMSVCLKRVLTQPELAAEAQSALALAEKEKFDLILLDVEMPGMDGFEICKRIRNMPKNRNTPVVFVTAHSDFDSRATATLIGAQEFLAKPAVSFEISVKALTLVLRNRLGHGTRAAAPEPTAVEPTAPAKPEALPAVENQSSGQGEGLGDSEGSVSGFRPKIKAFAGRSSRRVPKKLRSVRKKFETLSHMGPGPARQDILREMYIAICGLSQELQARQLPGAERAASVLARMIKKLLDSPVSALAYFLDTSATALDLIEEICRKEIRWNLENPSIRMLVVDDDPITQRVISTAVQLAFDRPDCANSGEDAVKLASEKSYDVIFLDVVMPGMDGYAACAKIRQTAANCATPIVFVTGQGDEASREQASRSGGNGFIPKPMMAVEIALTALTFALRGRLDKLEALGVLQDAAA
jgi:CheY-like chemotaxis protein